MRDSKGHVNRVHVVGHASSAARTLRLTFGAYSDVKCRRLFAAFYLVLGLCFQTMSPVAMSTPTTQYVSGAVAMAVFLFGLGAGTSTPTGASSDLRTRQTTRPSDSNLATLILPVLISREICSELADAVSIAAHAFSAASASDMGLGDEDVEHPIIIRDSAVSMETDWALRVLRHYR
jgi:hypothetical protein